MKWKAANKTVERQEENRGYLRIDESGRSLILGGGLRRQLQGLVGCYTYLSSEQDGLYFQKSNSVPNLDEFTEPIILQGNIAALESPVEVINFISSSRLSGNLIFLSQKTRKCLYFSGGEVRAASSNQVEDRLGESMYRFGALSREQLERSLAESRRIRRPLGNYLLDRGLVTQKDLYVHVRRQVEEIFYSILRIQEGDFILTKLDTEAFSSPLSLSTQSLLMEGLRRIDEMALFRQSLPDAQVKVVATGRSHAKELNSNQKHILRLLRAPLSLGELTQQLRIGEFATLKLLYALIKSGLIKVVKLLEEVPLQAEDAMSEVAGTVDTFNSVFGRIYQAIAQHGKEDALEQGLETFLQFYGFVELFQGVRFDREGHLNKARLLENLQQNPVDNRVSFLSQALNELLFFEMFAAREWLETEEQQALQKIINQLFVEIG